MARRIWTIYLLALALAGTSACVTTKRSKRNSARRSHRHSGKALTMDELTGQGEGEQAPRARKKRKAGIPSCEAAQGTSPADAACSPQKRSPALAVQAGDAGDEAPSNLSAGCVSVIQTYGGALKRLRAALAPNTYADTGSPLDRAVAARPEDCNAPATRAAAVRATFDAISAQSGRVGIILPLSGPRAKLAAFVLEGLRAGFRDAGLNFEAVAVVKDSGGDARLVDQRLAELVFKDHVGLVIGGLEGAEAPELTKWSQDLMLPVILLTRDRDLPQQARFGFRVYPDETRLAQTLAAAAAKRNYRRFVILRPAGGKSDKISAAFKDAVVAGGGTIVNDLVYQPDNFESMSAVSRTMFKADAEERRDEYQRAYWKARQQAKAQGVPFDPRLVVLKPIVDFDAVFLPDDFRTVRHFAKLFRFNMVSKLPMIGNHEWRSPGLVEPFDDFLEGSLFADFIGSYTKVPSSLGVATVGSPYFVAPDNVVRVDFQLVGYRAGRTAGLGLRTLPAGAQRKDVAAALQKLPSDAAQFFGQGLVFDAQRSSNWPTYVFDVSNGQIVLEN
jgi:hypothetical protein